MMIIAGIFIALILFAAGFGLGWLWRASIQDDIDFLDDDYGSSW